jgi:hypothetical protein
VQKAGRVSPSGFLFQAQVVLTSLYTFGKVNFTEWIMSDISNFERIWDQLLSRKPQLIKNAFAGLEKEVQQTVLVHLKEMTTGSGWHPEQVKSAAVALEAILK